jgi:hypothetical protein
MSTDKTPATDGQQPKGLPSTMEKTDLIDVDDIQVGSSSGKITDVMPVVVKVAKAAAMESIKEELELYRGLVTDAENVDDRLKVIRELSDLKLRSIGLVLAGMRQAGGQRQEPTEGQVLTKLMDMGAESLNPDSFDILTKIMSELIRARPALRPTT